MSWRPTAKLQQLRQRAEFIRQIRDFFQSRNVLEVQTPCLDIYGNPDPNIQSIATDTPGWLRTSPEFPLKRLLAAGYGDVYELGPVFRAGESGRLHNAEFTMLEWYRVSWTYQQLIEEVLELIQHTASNEAEYAVNRFSYRKLFKHYAGIDPFTISATELATSAQHYYAAADQLTRRDQLDLLLSHLIQTQFDYHTITIIYDYPPDQAALAKIRSGTTPVAERFEIYVGQMELANGYQELTDAVEQEQRFQAENQLRLQHGQPAIAVDQQLLAALQHGLPECSGVALGVDRLIMFLTGADSIHQVQTFPLAE